MTKYTVFWEPINDDWTISIEKSSVEVKTDSDNNNDIEDSMWEDSTMDYIKDEWTKDNNEDEQNNESDIEEKWDLTWLNKDERKVEEFTEDLSDDLKEIEDLINIWIDWTSEWNDWENTNIDEKWKEWLEKAIKTIKNMQSKIEKLELENAEYMKFGQDAILDPEIVILKHNYPKAKKWDQAALDKIKDLLKRDLWLWLSDISKVTLADSISWSLDTSEPIWKMDWTLVF